MKIHFNQVLQLVIEKFSILKNYKDANFYIIRDVFGRISIYVEKGVNDEGLLSFIRNLLNDTIGNPWINNVEQIQMDSSLARNLKEISKRVVNTDNVFLGERHLTRLNWFKTEKRKFKKHNYPSKVVTFYSFKGGIGRTTSMVLTALQLVRMGKKVIVVDFDLEAPGLSTLLIPENNQFSDYGVVDYLLESQIYSNSNIDLDIDEYVYTIQDKGLIGSAGGQLYVVPASNLNISSAEMYLEKMGRLDFNSPNYFQESNPISNMISQFNERFKPDFIFFDARTGIHDVGGLTLTQFTDICFLLFYGNEQNMSGMKMVLPKVIETGIPFFLINSPVPISEEEAEEEKEFYIENAYNLLIETGYYDEDKLPDLYEENAEHYPYMVNYHSQAVLLNSNKKISTLLEDEGKSNIYLKLAEQIASYDLEKNSLNSKINIGENKKGEILSQISEIMSGKLAASENEFLSDEDLTNKFYPLKEHRFIFEPEKFLILGPKGSGKTALFSVLEHSKYAKHLASYLGLSTESINKTNWITGLKLSSDFPSSDTFELIGKAEDLSTYRRYWKLLALKSLSKYINDLGIISDDIKDSLNSVSSLRELANDMYLSEQIEVFLSRLDNQLSEKNENITIVYDALDVLLLNRQYRGKMISALIWLWYEYLPRYKNIRVKIFLRDDIFNNEVMDIPDKVKLRNFSEKLAWTYDELLAMVWKRMAQKSNKIADLFQDSLSPLGLLIRHDENLGYLPKADTDINKVFLNVLIGERMGTGKAAFSYNWIRNHLADTNEKIVPRSIIKLFATAAVKEQETTELFQTTSNLIRPKSLDAVMQEVSSDRVTDLLEEYKEYEGIFRNLKEYLPRFPAYEEDLVEALRKCGIPKGKEISTIQDLVHIGVMKSYQRKKSDPIRYHIPDIFLIGLGLSRVGLKARN